MRNLVIVSNRGPFVFSEDTLTQAEHALANGTVPATPPKFGEGGLVQAMAGLLKPGNWNPIWIGASMGDQDVAVASGHYSELFKRMYDEHYAPDHFPHIEIKPDKRIEFRYKEYDFYMRFVFFDTEHMHSYYNKFSNGFLWPLMHLTREPLFYKVKKEFPKPSFEKSDFLQYMSSGVTFANTVFDETRKNRKLWQAGDDFVVWIQDYHLMQMADTYKALLIEGGVPSEDLHRIHVGQFMHTPFFNIHDILGLIREDKRRRLKAKRLDPFPESFERVLKRLTWGMLANDFIGFHTKEYCDNYLSALQEWFPVEIRQAENVYEITHSNGTTAVSAFPIGLDVDKILEAISGEKPVEGYLGGERLYDRICSDREQGRYIFGGLERCDYTKGLLERLRIFHHALTKLRNTAKRRADDKREGRLYQITSPSRLANPDYQYLKQVLDKEIIHQNKVLKRDYDPVLHLDEGVPPPQNYRLMKEIDVMLVTPVEDGMNLVAYEYILSQKYKRPETRGILVLGNCGAARSLKSGHFDEIDGIVYINPLTAKTAGTKTAEALLSGAHISDRLIDHVENQCRVDEWAQKNIDAIVNSKRPK